METITIQNPITCENPFVVEATRELTDNYLNPYPCVEYDYDGNEVQIDGEWYTLEPDVQRYLEDIDRQIDSVPIREVRVESRTLEIIDADDRTENDGLSPSDDDWKYNGLIRFVR